MNDNLYIEDEFEIPSLNTMIETREIKGRDGFLLGERKVEGFNFPIPFIYVNHENKEYQDIVNELVEFFNREEEVRLRFENEYWYWNVVFTGTIQFKQETDGFVRFELNCIIADPYKYSNERYSTVSEDDHLTIYNRGTAPTYPVFKATAKRDSTMIMISKNDEEYFMLGEGADVFQETKDLSPVVYSTDHSSISGWTRRTNSIDDNITGGAVGGSLTSDGESFIVSDYGESTNGWYGGALQRSLSSTLSDFEISTVIEIHPDLNRRRKGLIKGTVHLADETGNLVASIGLIDTQLSVKDTRVVVRIYDRNGNAKNIYYARQSPNAFRFGKVHITLKKQGNAFTASAFKSTEENGSTKISSRMNRKFIDTTGDYDRSVRQLITYVSKYTGEDNEVPLYIYETKVKRILPDEAGVIPLAIKRGDIIEIDNQQEIMLLNGAPATELKDFGATYFDVPASLTEIFIHPEDTFDVTAEWRDRYH
ncbi:distal tail protein Dit [Salinicoccus halitifaciens]|uniref:Phage tail component-like protein n=1 Tax=Salinicoccus halitifaciens TaxID=1073415 RepID=A0ABV2E6T4_9STAP|nr:distal tail protein Dit [Salinicoccus halitifaciens]MCD2137166.1 phage tail family protein [Salinicoccus halitifaciens]